MYQRKLNIFRLWVGSGEEQMRTTMRCRHCLLLTDKKKKKKEKLQILSAWDWIRQATELTGILALPKPWSRADELQHLYFIVMYIVHTIIEQSGWSDPFFIRSRKPKSERWMYFMVKYEGCKHSGFCPCLALKPHRILIFSSSVVQKIKQNSQDYN